MRFGLLSNFPIFRLFFPPSPDEPVINCSVIARGPSSPSVGVYQPTPKPRSARPYRGKRGVGIRIFFGPGAVRSLRIFGTALAAAFNDACRRRKMLQNRGKRSKIQSEFARPPGAPGTSAGASLSWKIPLANGVVVQQREFLLERSPKNLPARPNI